MEHACETPALARGLKTLRELNVRGDMSLDDLSNTLGFPKASLLRILRTLQSFGYVTRCPNRLWRAEVCLARHGARDAEALIRHSGDVLDELVRATRQTGELYHPEDDVLVLIDRRECFRPKMTVSARVGFRRQGPELEATTRIRLAFAENRGSVSGMNIRKWGEEIELSEAAAEERLRAAKDAFLAFDEFPNSNGVRRSATPLLARDGSFNGVLAVAVCGDDARDDEKMKKINAAVLAAGEKISIRLGFEGEFSKKGK